jgi:stage II sporulation protein M
MRERAKMKRITDIIKKNLCLALAAAIAFLVGIPLGALAYPYIADKLPLLLEKAFEGVLTGSTQEIILKVFLRNTSASIIMLMAGITVILTLAILFLNGFFVGLIIMFAMDRGINIWSVLFGIIPHGTFELPAIFLSAALGMRVGLKIISQKGRRIKAASEAIREASAVYLLVVVPLLIIAAVVEILVSRHMIR